MQEALFILTVLGCNDAATQCTKMEIEQVQYASVDQCYAESEAVIIANSEAPYPVFLARCDAPGSVPADGTFEDIVIAESLEAPIPTEVNDEQTTPTEEVAQTSPQVEQGVWYRVRPRAVLSTVTKPAKELVDGVGNVASSAVEGAGNAASSAVEGAGNVLKKTGETINRLNPLN
ncbi:MAG: hypothetical protein AAFY99_15475 [Pseudomonadota bacterium]